MLVDGSVFAEHGYLQQVRPRLFSYGSFVWVHDLLGEGWWKQRLFNLLVHIAVVMSLWGFYREILRHIEPPLDESGPPQMRAQPYRGSPALGLAIGFFALNPVAVYAGAYLIQRSILMRSAPRDSGALVLYAGLGGGAFGLFSIGLGLLCPSRDI